MGQGGRGGALGERSAPVYAQSQPRPVQGPVAGEPANRLRQPARGAIAYDKRPANPGREAHRGREACRGGFETRPCATGSLRERDQLLNRSSHGYARINLTDRECRTRAGLRGTPKNASAFFGDPGPAPTRTTSVVPLCGLGLGYGLLICDCPAPARGNWRGAPKSAVADLGIVMGVDACEQLAILPK